MHPTTTRVVYDNRPYLLVGEAGRERAYGPFTPGTEPSLAECTEEREVRDRELLANLQRLRAISPDLPPHSDSLAGRE